MLLSRTVGSFAGVVAAIASIAACNAISGLDADYEIDSTPTTIVPDAQPADGSQNPDDAGPTPDAEVGGFCPSSNVFCEDFENTPATSPFGWTRHETIAGTPDVLTGDGFESPRALHATAAPVGSSAKVVIWRTVEGGLPPGETLTVDFRFRVKSTSIDYVVVAAVQLNNREYGLAVYRNPACGGAGTCLDENDPMGGHAFVGSFQYAPGTWYRGRIVVTRSGESFSGKVFVDDNALDDRTADALPPGAPRSVEVGFGAFYTGASGVTETDIDNVVVTRTP